MFTFPYHFSAIHGSRGAGVGRCERFAFEMDADLRMQECTSLYNTMRRVH
ncbi:WD repeat protein [Anopheles sinensis]|uniref:WD repeat protein n=1 Tax=Anopheles sinensis TaxID=74873 RepID=A0A084WAT1_ANOSI|nr:WD repeat protein [Anopheles sinensis]